MSILQGVHAQHARYGSVWVEGHERHAVHICAYVQNSLGTGQQAVIICIALGEELGHTHMMCLVKGLGCTQQS